MDPNKAHTLQLINFNLKILNSVNAPLLFSLHLPFISSNLFVEETGLCVPEFSRA